MRSQNSSFALIFWENKVLLFHRDNIPTIPHPDCWHLTGGGIEKGETPLQAVKRELQEEVSYIPKILKYVLKFKRTNGTSFLYVSFVDDVAAKKFKLGPGEGQEIKFFTIEEALNLKLTPILETYLIKFRKEIKEAMETKNISKITFELSHVQTTVLEN